MKLSTVSIFVSLFVILSAAGRSKEIPGKKESSSAPQTIPGTDLKTKTFYKLSMKRFPDGAVTWTEKKNDQSGYHYIQVDNNKEHLKKYKEDGEWFKDSQWEFIPESSKTSSGPKWYRLRNRAHSDQYATWSKNEFVNDNVKNGKANYIILDSKYPGKRPKTDFLFRPVKEKNEEEFYQLKLKQFSKGVVTWTSKEYGKDSHYIQVDRDEAHLSKYKTGGEWYVDTLFKFELVENENEGNEEEEDKKKKDDEENEDSEKKDDDDKSENGDKKKEKNKSDDDSSNDDDSKNNE